MNIKIWCLIICATVLDSINADCTLRLNKDFGSPSPVYLQHNKYMIPNGPAGTVVVNSTERVVIACPGKGKHVTAGQLKEQEVVEATCVANSTFKIKNNAATNNFSDFKCDSLPWFATEETDRICFPGNNQYRAYHDFKCDRLPWFATEETERICYPGNNQYRAYRVGYTIKNAFHKLYDLCFNGGLMHTAHAQHVVMPATADIQTGGRRPAFIEGTLFGNVKVANAYKVSNQKSRFDSLLGDGSAAKYLDKHFLTRGHLAPRADFPLHAMQRASFHYANAAPQWMKGNAGDWAALEDAIRRRAISLKRPLTVYTGSYGVSTLTHSETGRPVELYLGVDGNNNDVIPIPLYFFKVVYDPPTKRASAFVSVNSPFYNDTTLEQLTFCEDFCSGDHKPSWLRWRANDYTHSFCCSYEEFVRTIDVLPKLNVKGLFV